MLREGTKVAQLIQVCYDMRAVKTRKRELDALIECAEELKCENLVIITQNEEETITLGNHTIHVVPIHKF